MNHELALFFAYLRAQLDRVFTESALIVAMQDTEDFIAWERDHEASKKCVDCAHFDVQKDCDLMGRRFLKYMCKAPCGKQDLVHGWLITQGVACETMRMGVMCGPHAELFKEKTK